MLRMKSDVRLLQYLILIGICSGGSQNNSSTRLIVYLKVYEITIANLLLRDVVVTVRCFNTWKSTFKIFEFSVFSLKLFTHKFKIEEQ